MTRGVADLRLGRWQDVLADVDEVDALIVDAPYSARTHQGHARVVGAAGGTRRGLEYASFTPDDVAAFVDAWSPATRGWFVTLTDHVLAPVWADELAAHGRAVFSPVACVDPGSRVRLTGDGPSQWSVWAVVARPKSLCRWGTLPGAYVVPDGQRGLDKSRMAVAGGKPLWLMRALVRDYTRPGELVCDPCAGGGTTLLAALLEGREAVGAECLPEHYELAKRRLARGYTPTLFLETRAAEQLALEAQP